MYCLSKNYNFNITDYLLKNTPEQHKQLLRTNEKEETEEELRVREDKEITTAPPVTTTNRGLEKMKWILDSRVCILIRTLNFFVTWVEGL